MATVVLPENPEHFVTVPVGIVDLPSFFRWVESDEFPEHGRIDYLAGDVWVDMSEEQIFTHVAVKTEFTTVLNGLVRANDLGEYFTDGLYFADDANDLGVKPDGSFITADSFERARVQLGRGARQGYVRMLGVPDMILEVVSDSSVRKDTVRLRELYHRAGVREYWLVDVRGERMQFDIFRLTNRGYVATRPKDGWLESRVFGRSFQIQRRMTRAEVTTVKLVVK